MLKAAGFAPVSNNRTPWRSEFGFVTHQQYGYHYSREPHSVEVIWHTPSTFYKEAQARYEVSRKENTEGMKRALEAAGFAVEYDTRWSMLVLIVKGRADGSQ